MTLSYKARRSPHIRISALSGFQLDLVQAGRAGSEPNWLTTGIGRVLRFCGDREKI